MVNSPEHEYEYGELEVIEMAKTKFDWKIWAKKVAINAIAVLIAGGIVVWQDNPYWLVALPVLKAVDNYWKHS